MDGFCFGMRAGKNVRMQPSHDERFVFCIQGSYAPQVPGRSERNCFISGGFLLGRRPITPALQTPALYLTVVQPVITFILHLKQQEPWARWSRCGFHSRMQCDSRSGGSRGRSDRRFDHESGPFSNQQQQQQQQHLVWLKIDLLGEYRGHFRTDLRLNDV